MKITHNKVGTNLNISDSLKDKSKTDKKGNETSIGLEQVRAEQLRGDVGAGVATKKNDGGSIELSNRAQEFKRAFDIAKKTPDVRGNRVAELQKKIDEGTYEIHDDLIADKMVDEEGQWS
jgi:negative regulator of flagellin synthesis FlgM